MTDANSLIQLCELTQQQLDEAGQQLRRALDSGQQARQQLAQLHTYRRDYLGRAQQILRKGLSGTNYHNFMQFLAVLEQALTMQNTLVEQLEHGIVQAREHWQQKKRQRDALAALTARRARLAQQQEKRVEQRQTDERAARRAASAGVASIAFARAFAAPIFSPSDFSSAAA